MVLLYTQVPSGWERKATLSVDVEPSAFGTTVAVGHNAVVVGDPGRNSAYIYEFIDAAWQLRQTLTHKSSLFSNDVFGKSIAIEGDTIAIGAPSRQEGYVYLFQRTDRGWMQRDQLTLPLKDRPPGTANDLEINEKFGSQVKINGDKLAIGAPYAAVGSAMGGAVYLYQRHGDAWILESSLTPSSPIPNHQFGTVLDLSDDTLFVSANQGLTEANVYGFELNHSPATADIEVLLDVDFKHRGVGENLTFYVTISNMSDGENAEGVEAIIALASELEITSHPANCKLKNIGLVCNIGAIAMGQQKQIEVQARAMQVGNAISEVRVSANQRDPVKENDFSTTSVRIDATPPPQITILSPGQNSSLIRKLRESVVIELAVEHWPLAAAGKHILWELDKGKGGERNGLIFDSNDTAIDLKGLDSGAHQMRVALMDEDGIAIGVEDTILFDITRPIGAMPSVRIISPKPGEEFGHGSPIAVRYEIDYGDLAMEIEDFEWYLDKKPQGPLPDKSSLPISVLSTGEHSIGIRYLESDSIAGFDAEVTFSISATEDNSQPGGDPNKDDPINIEGGGSLSWLVMLLSIAHLRRFVMAKRVGY